MRSLFWPAFALCAFGAGALLGPRAATAEPGPPSAAAVECAAFPVPWVLRPEKADEKDRTQALPAGWAPVGGTSVISGAAGAISTAPGVVACRPAAP